MNRAMLHESIINNSQFTFARSGGNGGVDGAIHHAAGPIYYEHSPAEAESLLTSCYENSLELAREKELKTIAFPLISAGVYGYPQKDAIRVAIESMKKQATDFDEITLVLFGEREFGLAGEMYGEFAAFTTASAF